MKYAAVCLALSFLLVSCGEEETDTAELTLTMSSSKSIVVDAAQPNCSDEQGDDEGGASAASASVSFASIRISWASETDKLVLNAIKIKISNPNLTSDYSVSMGVSDIDDLFGLDGGILEPADPTGPILIDSLLGKKNNSSNEFEAKSNGKKNCRFVFGGIKYKENTSFTATGTLELQGYRENEKTLEQDIVFKKVGIQIQVKN